MGLIPLFTTVTAVDVRHTGDNPETAGLAAIPSAA
jgi:hypothetical protein